MIVRKYNGAMHLLHAILIAVGLVGTALARQPDNGFHPSGGAPDGSRLVSMDVILDHSAVAPGQEAMLAVRYRIETDWHLYWRNPGETGLAPGVKFEAPEWLSIGEPMWAAPERHEMPGPLVDFIYEKELLLLFPVTVSADAPVGSEGTVKATSDWLVCRRECLFGGGEATRSVTVASSATRSVAAGVIEAWRARVPRRLDEVRDPPVQVDWKGSALVIEAPGADRITFFPFQTDDDEAMPLDLVRQGIAEGDRLEAAYNEERLRDAPRVRGVVTIERGDETSSWEFELATRRTGRDSSD